MSRGLEIFLENDKEKLIRILRLFQLIAGVNKSIVASQEMESPSMVKQFQRQKTQFIEELNEILEKQYQLMLMD